MAIQSLVPASIIFPAASCLERRNCKILFTVVWISVLEIGVGGVGELAPPDVSGVVDGVCGVVVLALGVVLEVGAVEVLLSVLVVEDGEVVAKSVVVGIIGSVEETISVEVGIVGVVVGASITTGSVDDVISSA
jgi:hypothetical protein